MVLQKAEEIIKNTFVENNSATFEEALLNLEGMECRWKQINPTQSKEKVICLLLDSLNGENQGAVYRDVHMQMDALFGTFKSRHPIKSNSLKLNFSISKI